MKNIIRYLLVLLLGLQTTSCRKLKDYFRNPDTEYLIETIHAVTTTGYAANVAMAIMQGQSFSNILVTRSNTGFPCTTTMIVNLNNDDNLFISPVKADAVTIIGLWSDASTAILNLLYTNYQAGDDVIELLGIETIPVIRDGDNIAVALATADISLNPDEDALLQINLSTLEIESELFRLDMPHPTDVYVAVSQKAYFIDIDNNGSTNTLSDDAYRITGGGQMVEVAFNSEEIAQMALINVEVSSSCTLNPVDGNALLRIIGLESKGFPELGTALLQFSDDCTGEANVMVATGMYIASNGSDISFEL